MAEHTWKYIEDNAAFLENISLERVVLDVLKIPLHFFFKYYSYWRVVFKAV